MNKFTTDSIIAVIGAGTMGAGIAQVAAKANHQVLLFDVAKGAAEKGIDNIRKGLDKLVLRGRMTQFELDALVSRIVPISEINQLASADLVIEAIVEKLEVKQTLFRQLEDICHVNTILASNTSSISITAIGAKLLRPENLIGMHFFNPAPIMKLVEVISGLDTDKQVADNIFELAVNWGKLAVHAKSTPGFIANRVARPFYAESLRVLQEGATDIATIDELFRSSGGFKMGPFELMDLIGHDVNYAVTCSVFDAFYQDQRFLPSLIQKELLDAGHLGRKSGRGFYQYPLNKPTENSKQQADSVLTTKVITIEGNLGAAESLLPLFEHYGLQINRVPAAEEQPKGEGKIIIDDATLMLTNGQFTTERATKLKCPNLVHFDLSLDYQQANVIALAPSSTLSLQALNNVIALFQTIEKKVVIIDDVPGMVLMRTICMLANEGFDAVNQQVCNEDAVDIAMKAGLNYPCGPIMWANNLGLRFTLTVLNNLATTYGEDRFRASPLLQRKVAQQQLEVIKNSITTG
ncbi:3-hydroxyacyl-CoA dehydrogenase [Thalassotalea piscium]